MSQSGWKCALMGALLVAACASSPPRAAPATAAMPGAAPAGTSPPATPPAGGKEALLVIKEIEADPFREDEPFRVKRMALIDWLEKSPDITIDMCEALLPHLDVDARPHDSVLLVQTMFGQAAYLLEHPGTSSEDQAVFTSGLVAAIRAYRKLVVLHPQERLADWDQLDAAERQNGLAPRVKSAIKSCGKP